MAVYFAHNNMEVSLASVNISNCRQFPWLYSDSCHAVL